MKSYFLEELTDETAARNALSEMLPRQSDPWVLFTEEGDDSVAYFNVESGDDDCVGPFVIVADISGRHYNSDDIVLTLLDKLRLRLGGVIRDDWDLPTNRPSN